jgi:hypothetical protein
MNRDGGAIPKAFRRNSNASNYSANGSDMKDDKRPTWKPFTEYILRYGDRKRAEGNPSPDIAPPEYWDKRRQDEANKQLPLSKAA